MLKPALKRTPRVWLDKLLMGRWNIWSRIQLTILTEILPAWTKGGRNGTKWRKAVRLLNSTGSKWSNNATQLWRYVVLQEKERMTLTAVHRWYSCYCYHRPLRQVTTEGWQGRAAVQLARRTEHHTTEFSPKLQDLMEFALLDVNLLWTCNPFFPF